MSIDTTSQTVTADQAKAFMADTGLIIDELTGSRVPGTSSSAPSTTPPGAS